MYPFDHQNILRSQLQIIPAVLPLPRLEIEPGHLHSSAFQKIAHILIKLADIYRFQTLIIRFSVFIQRRVFPIDKIIVHCYGCLLYTSRCV